MCKKYVWQIDLDLTYHVLFFRPKNFDQSFNDPSSALVVRPCPSSPSHNRLPVSVYNLFFDQSKFVSENTFNVFQDSTTSKLQEFQDFQ